MPNGATDASGSEPASSSAAVSASSRPTSSPRSSPSAPPTTSSAACSGATRWCSPSSSPCSRPSGHPSSSSGRYLSTCRQGECYRSFVAIMTKAYPNVERNELILLQEIATYMLLACEAVHIIAGILCLGVLKRSRQHKATSQEQAVKDLEELEKRREELESLLIAERPETA